MLMDLVMELVTAADAPDKERAYRRLEKVGVDRRTADVMAAEFYNAPDDKNCEERGGKDGGPEENNRG